MVAVRCALACWVLVSTGCNLVFGVDPDDTVDTIDARDGEPASCPPLGAAPMEFSTTIEEVVPRPCFYFTVSKATGQGYASCTDSGVLEGGPVGGPLEPLALAPSLLDAYVDRPAIAPEGDQMLVRQIKDTVQRISWYARGAAGWTWRADLLDASGLTSVGVPSAGPERRAIVATAGGYHEFVERGDTWAELRVSPWTTLGVTGGAEPHLSPDALRLTFVYSSAVMYAERADRADEFGPATHLASVGTTPSAFLTEDCARMYYAAGGAVVFRRRL